jgi:hypothetical protein
LGRHTFFIPPLRAMPPKTSTLTKGTSVSDSRRQGAQAQRALSDNRREIRPADLAKAAGTKRGRENEEATAVSEQHPFPRPASGDVWWCALSHP